MSNKKKTVNSNVQKAPKKKNERFVLIFVCIFMSVVLLGGAIFGTVYAVRAANSALEYNGVRMSKSAANYFASYAKGQYLAELRGVEGAEDTEEFWNSYARGTTTHGDAMKKYVENYLRMVVVGCYLFDSVSHLDSKANATIKKQVESRLKFFTDGDKRKFNSDVEQFGFDYDGFCEATEMIYKTQMARYLLYGADGSSLKTNTALADEYYSLAYKRVKLLFIRTESRYKLDGEGKRVSENGKEILYPLSPGEISGRLDDIASIDAAIAGEGGTQMSQIAFEGYLNDEKYKADNLYLDPMGEYYSTYLSSEYTVNAYRELPDVVLTAIGMQVGTFKKVEIEGVGVCYISALELNAGAYADTDEDGPFSDFYTLLAEYKYNSDVEAELKNVSLNDKFYETDLITLPVNGTYTIGI